MNNLSDKKLKELQTFESFNDNEFLEAMEDMEKLNRGKLSENELKKNNYIRKTRENLAGGDA